MYVAPSVFIFFLFFLPSVFVTVLLLQCFSYFLSFFDEQKPFLKGKPSRAPSWMAVSTSPPWVSLCASNPLERCFVYNEANTDFCLVY